MATLAGLLMFYFMVKTSRHVRGLIISIITKTIHMETVI